MSARLILMAMLLCRAQAQTGPQPPCGTPPVPAYPSLDEPAAVKLWSRADFGSNWKPPVCTGWTGAGFTTLVSVAGRFQQGTDASGLLRRIGAISQLAGTRYWSTTHKQWQVLIVEAHAVSDTKAAPSRADFTPDEMKAGAVLYFEQSDNLSGKAIYRMHIAEATADRIVFDVENVSTLRYLLITLFHPSEMQSIYFLDRESENVWRYYSMLRTGKNANGLTAGNEASSINRAVALYRQLAGMPGDREPPAAR